MKFPIFASFIVFLVWLAYEIKKNNRLYEKIDQDFWEKESMANNVRKKNLDSLPYISVPIELLPAKDSLQGQSQAELDAISSLEILQDLKDKRILNLNGISNTDIKLTYGTANITVLSEYDANFETFSKHIYQLSQKLYELGRINEAQDLLEHTLSTGTDITGHYRLLARIYLETGHADQISNLIETAQNLRSMTKDMIIHSLEEMQAS